MAVLQTVNAVDRAELSRFQGYVFGLLGATDHRAFSDKLCAMQASDPGVTARLQDEVCGSEAFASLVRNPAWRATAASILDTDQSDIDIVFPHFRIDLPSVFSADESRMSLPWHQEAGYYLAKGGCTPNSIVLSTYLHDCDARSGALLVGENTQAELVDHDERYMDEENRRFLRVTCPAPAAYREAGSRFGETVAFDFMRPHKSGVNTSSLVRLTVLLRASSKADVEQWQASQSPDQA